MNNDPNGLLDGGTYRIDRDTPLMPEPDPDDPLAALKLVKIARAGGSLRVVRTEVHGPRIWYRVRTEDAATGVEHVGWVNSAALHGQALEEVRIDGD